MNIEMFVSKIHRVKITQAELNYMGSITIDEDLLDAANILNNQKVQVVNLNNGERLETYAIVGPRNSGTICMNGPAARKVQVGDIVIVMAYASMTVEEAKNYTPTIIFPNENNKYDGEITPKIWDETKVQSLIESEGVNPSLQKTAYHWFWMGFKAAKNEINFAGDGIKDIAQ